jgi:hypothetical protein
MRVKLAEVYETVPNPSSGSSPCPKARAGVYERHGVGISVMGDA